MSSTGRCTVIAGAGERTTLVGRDHELTELSRLLTASAAGVGGVAWIRGEGGVGKSRLASATVRRAAETGVTARYAAASEFDRHRPFAVISDCLRLDRPGEDPRRRHAAQLLAPAADAHESALASPELERGVGAAVIAIVEDLCARGPLMLALDDLQWADPPSLDLLGVLADRADELPLVLIGLARGLPRREELLRVVASARERGASEIDLGPLGRESVAAIAAELTGARVGDRLSALVAGCGGNPLYIELLIAGLAADGAITTESGIADIPGTSATPTIDSAILGRLSALSGDAVDLLRLAAVLGSAFSVGDLSLLTGRSAASIWDGLRDAMAAGVVVEHGSQLALAHDIVRSALYRDLPVSVRTALHAEFGRRGTARGGPATTVAEHLLRGAQPGDREAVSWLERAALEIEPRGAAAATELLEAALAIAGPDDPARGRVMAALGRTLIHAGRLEAGEAMCRQVLAERGDPAGEAALRLTLIRSLFEGGRLQEMMREAAVVAESGTATAAERAMARYWLISGPMFSGDIPGAEAAAHQALAAGRAAASAAAVAASLVRLGHLAVYRGAFVDAERWTAEAEVVAEADGSADAHRTSQAFFNHALTLADSDRAEEGIESIRAGRRTYERLGMEEAVRQSHLFSSYAPFVGGRWDDALTETQTALELAQGSGIAWTTDILTLQSVILIRRDELEVAAEMVTGTTAAIEAGRPEFRLGFSRWSRALLAEARGDDDEALAHLWEGWSTVTAAGALGAQRTLAPDLARMLAAAGDRERLAVVVEAIESLAARNPGLASLGALALGIRGLASADAAVLLAAGDAHPGDPRPLEHGLLCENAAVLLAGSGDRERAADVARGALERYAMLGAARDAARLAGRLRARGLRLGARGSRQRDQTGWGSLTPSERRVADLAADGLSNPQIAERLVVSRHTVATHVSHILAKLELRSRFELTAARPPA